MAPSVSFKLKKQKTLENQQENHMEKYNLQCESDLSMDESIYIYCPEEYIDDGFSYSGTEDKIHFSQENKALMSSARNQAKHQKDFSEVILPTCMLEPRSFLDKLSDFFCHVNLLSSAVIEGEPYMRMLKVIRWYCSGFYKMDNKKWKKPYNPIQGETFRCYWKHPNGSKTFYVANQVSNDPPTTSLYVRNEQEGFVVSATIVAKSMYFGNSASAILDGNVCVTLLPQNENYIITIPNAHWDNLYLQSRPIFELIGKVIIECEDTALSAHLEFQLQSHLHWISSTFQHNIVSGTLKLGKTFTFGTIFGYWDEKIVLTEKSTGDIFVLWKVNKDIKACQLPCYTISPDKLEEWDSEKLWHSVSVAIRNNNQTAAMIAKDIVEKTTTRKENEKWNQQLFSSNGRSCRMEDQGCVRRFNCGKYEPEDAAEN